MMDWMPCPALISIHAPARGATLPGQQVVPAVLVFQFTPLREGRRVSGGALYSLFLFQFTPLREGRPMQFTARRATPTHFNSRPCERGDRPCLPVSRPAEISIHAPARGATRPSYSEVKFSEYISIHAPARGATGNTTETVSTITEFQFTPLREGRP